MRTADCADGQFCVDGRCQTQAPDAGPGLDAGHDAGGDGGVDAGARCESGLFCGTPPVCCESGTECIEGACLPTCESGVRCGVDSMTCCGTGQVCVDATCETPGEECEDSFDCGEGAFCEPTLARCLPQFDPVTCEREPVFGDFATTEEWSFTTPPTRTDCMHAISSPVVIDLDGDRIPEVIANMACDADWGEGALHVVRGDTGEHVWTSPVVTHGRISVAAGDLTGDGAITIVTMTAASDGRRAIAFDAEGNELWRSTDEEGDPLPIAGDNNAPTLADLDGDGRAEIIWGGVALDSGGVRLWTIGSGGSEGTNNGYTGGISAVGDIDDDGLIDVVSGRRAMERDGTEKWLALVEDGYPALAQFDDDANAEVVLVADGDVYILDGADGSVQWGPVAIPGTGRGGPPTVADFDGDGEPEIGVAAGAFYAVFDPGREEPLVWQQPTIDQSSNATGSSVFDFEGDGSAEVVYQEECYVRVYAGDDGEVLFEQENTSATIHEFPLVVDVDGDGNSEIVVVANDRHTSIVDRCVSAYPGYDRTGERQGIFVYGDANDQWVGTRRIWNQHAYSVTNVEASGRVPAAARDNWEVPGLNNFRQNVQGEGIYNAPDVVVAAIDVDLGECPSHAIVRARVQNIGNLGVGPGIPVGFYRGTLADPGARLGAVVTTRPLLPGASEVVELRVPLVGAPPFAFHAVADDDFEADESVEECREDNNRAEIGDVSCDLLI